MLPHVPTSPNAYDPTDTALGFIGGILCGADKLARVAHLAHDPAVAEVLGIEAISSPSTLSRFFARCGRAAAETLSGLHAWALRELPARTEGYTLDLDSFSLLHEDDHQQGVRVGYTRKASAPTLCLPGIQLRCSCRSLRPRRPLPNYFAFICMIPAKSSVFRSPSRSVGRNGLKFLERQRRTPPM